MIRAALCLFLATSSLASAQVPTLSPVQKAERDLFEKVVEIPTVPGRGEMPRLTKLLSDEFRKSGITDIVVKSYSDTQTLIARWPAPKSNGKKPILLMAHMDVVEAKASDWTDDPFIFRETDGYYLGRGSNDNKAGLVAIVATLKRLKAAGFVPDRDIIVLFTGDEENTGEGARRAVGEWRALIDAEYALNSDGGGGSVFRDGRVDGFDFQIAEKTYADYTFVATNRGGHSSVPRPDNAIYQLASALKALESYRFAPMLNDASRARFASIVAKDKGVYGSIVRAWLDDPANMEKADLVEANEPGSTRTRCVATMLTGGHAPNALPQKAEATVNCRIFPGIKPSDVRDELQAIVGKDVVVTLAEGSTWSDASPVRDDVLSAYRTAVQKRFPDASVVPSMEAGATDGAFLRAGGIPTYGVAGMWVYAGEPNGIHGLNERIPIKAFHDQIDIWEDMLKDLAGGK